MREGGQESVQDGRVTLRRPWCRDEVGPSRKLHTGQRGWLILCKALNVRVRRQLGEAGPRVDLRDTVL